MRITHTPLPTLSTLFKAALMKSKPDMYSSSKWCKTKDRAYWFSRSAWSLVAITLLRQNVNCKPLSAINVYIPDFFCNMSTILIRQLGVNLVFYPINQELFPVEDVCNKLQKKVKPDLFIHVHYFGIPINAEWSFDFCKQNNAWLIEDATHVLYPIGLISKFGDFVLYSPHKLLPIPDGALMVVRDEGPANLLSENTIINTLDKVVAFLYRKSGFNNFHSFIWLFKKLLQIFGIRPSQKAPFLLNSEIASCKQYHPKMSFLSKRLLSFFVDSLDSVANLRKENADAWYRYISSLFNFEQLEFIRNPKHIPYMACFVFNNQNIAEEIYRKWKTNNMPVMTWPDLPPEVLYEKNDHMDAIRLRLTRLYLPVHQSITKKDIIQITWRLRYR